MLPSLAEPFGLVLLEAMALGKPWLRPTREDRARSCRTAALDS